MGSGCGTAARISSRCVSTVRSTGVSGSGAGGGGRTAPRSMAAVACTGSRGDVGGSRVAPLRRSSAVVSRGALPVPFSLIVSMVPPAGSRSGLRRALGGQVGHEAGQPGAQGRAEVLPLGGQPDDRLEVVELVAGVVA